MLRPCREQLLSDGVRDFIRGDNKTLKMLEEDRRVMLCMAERRPPDHIQPTASHSTAARHFANKIYAVFSREPRAGFITEVPAPEPNGVRIDSAVLDSEQIGTILGNHDEARFLTSHDGDEVGVMFSGGGTPVRGIFYMATNPDVEVLAGYNGFIEEMWIQGGNVTVSTQDGSLSASTRTVDAAPESDRYLHVSFAPGTAIRLHVEEAAYAILRWTKVGR